MEQFDLKEYLANPSRKVVTRDGRNVKIISTDMNCENYPIVALAKLCDSSKEEIFLYTKDGEFEFGIPSRYDLFFAPEKHEGWVNIYKVGKNKKCGFIYETEEAAKSQFEPNEHIATVKVEWEE